MGVDTNSYCNKLINGKDILHSFYTLFNGGWTYLYSIPCLVMDGKSVYWTTHLLGKFLNSGATTSISYVQTSNSNLFVGPTL